MGHGKETEKEGGMGYGGVKKQGVKGSGETDASSGMGAEHVCN